MCVAGPRATRMRRLAQGNDSQSDCDEEDQEDNEQREMELGGARQDRQRESEGEQARYERLQRLQEQAIAAALQVESEEQAAASPLPPAALALPRGRWDDLPRCASLFHLSVISSYNTVCGAHAISLSHSFSRTNQTSRCGAGYQLLRGSQ